MSNELDDQTLDNIRNPFAAPLTMEGSRETILAESPPRDVSKTWIICRWTMVCFVSAIPSFFVAASTVAPQQWLAMLLGIFIFIVGYVTADLLSVDQSWRKSNAIRLAMKIAYGIRIGASVIFPVALYTDMVCGIFSVSCVAFLMGSQENFERENFGFIQTLATTLVQGVVLNIVILILTMFFLGVLKIANYGGDKPPVRKQVTTSANTTNPFHD